MKNNLLVCIDGGASTYRAALIEINSKKILRECKEDISLKFSLTKENLKNLIKVIEKVNSKKAEVIVLGLAGLDTDIEKQKANKIYKFLIKRYFPNFKEVYILNDLELMMSVSNAKNKIAVVAGTGSNCIGVKNGVFTKAGGFGHLLSDQGSGYYIGLLSLKKALKASDGREQKTILVSKLCKYFGVRNIENTKDTLQNSYTKKEISQLSKVVAKCADLNDLVSKKILQNSVAELFKHIKAVHTKLNLNTEMFDLVLVGGIFTIPLVQKGILGKVAIYNIGKIYHIKDKTYLAGIDYYNTVKNLANLN